MQHHSARTPVPWVFLLLFLLALLFPLLSAQSFAETKDEACGTPHTGAACADMRISRAELQRTAKSQLADALSVLAPQFANPHGGALDGSNHVNYASLHGFAPDQLLILINGKRRHPTALLDRSDSPARGSTAVDLNAIPIAAIKHVELRFGGQSARHGSGAIAGTLNIVLEDAASGAHLSGNYTQFRGQMNDVPEITIVNPVNSTGLLDIGAFGSRNVDDGDGDQLDVSGSWGTGLGEADGFMRISAQYRTQDETSRAGYDPRQQFAFDANGDFDIREASVNRLNTLYGRPETTDLNILLNARLPLTANLTLYGFTALGARDSESAAAFVRPIDPTNVAAIYPFGFLPEVHSDIDDRSFVAGLTGRYFGWDWDFAVNQGENEIDWEVRNSLNSSFGALSQTRFSVGNNEHQMQMVSLDASRAIEVGTTRPLHIEAGVSFRKDDYEIEQGESAAISNGGITTSEGTPLPGASQGFAGFATEETDKINTLAYRTAATFTSARGHAVSAALRWDDVDDIDGQLSGQLSGALRVNDKFSLNANLSRDFRAPAMAQRQFQAVTLSGDQMRSGIFNSNSDVVNALRPELEAERAHTARLALRYSPTPALQVSAAAFVAAVDDQIVLGDPLQSTSLQAAAGTHGITDLATVQMFVNAGEVRHTGIDLDADFTTPFRNGTLKLDLGLSYQRTQLRDSNAAAVALGVSESLEARVERARARVQWIVNANWERGRFTTNLRLRGFGKVIDATPLPLAAPIAPTDVDAAWLADLDLAYAPDAHLTLSVGIHNILDEFPDVRSRGTIHGTLYPFPSVSPFGFDGRTFFARMQKSFE